MSELDEILRRPLETLLPHRDPMILLTRAVGMAGEDFVAEVDVSEDSPFFDGRGVPAWIGLEYMAQTVAALAGVEGALEGKEASLGLLLASRVYSSVREHFWAGETLRIIARKVLRMDSGLGALECFIRDRDGNELVRAELTVIQMPSTVGLP